MCNCIVETEERYKEHLLKNDKAFKDIDDIDVSLKNKAYMYGSGNTEITIPITIEWEHTFKTKRKINKSRVDYFNATYCPFCGEKNETKSKGGI